MEGKSLDAAAISPCDSADARGARCLFFADLSNPDRSRTDQKIYRIQEPAIPSTSSATPLYTALADAYPVVYELPADDPAPNPDAGSLMVHPRTGKLYIITKEDTRGRVLESDPPGAPGAPLVFRPVGELPLDHVTDAAIAHHGGALIARNRSQAFEYFLSDDDVAKALQDSTGTRHDLPDNQRGATIAYARTSVIRKHLHSWGYDVSSYYGEHAAEPLAFLTVSDEAPAVVWSNNCTCGPKPVSPPPPEPTNMDEPLDMDLPAEDMSSDDMTHSADLDTSDMGSDMSNTGGNTGDGCAAAGGAAPAALAWLLIPLSGRRRRRPDVR